MERTYHSPPRNMVQEVRNIIESYKMGPIRALLRIPCRMRTTLGRRERRAR